MRWRYIDEANGEERASRQQLMQTIDRWWSEFARRENDISDLFSQRQQWDLAGWMAEHLRRIDPRLCYEFGPAVHKSGHRLVITPECDRHLRPMIEVILQRAPAIPAWEFYAYRLPEDMEMAAQTVKFRANADLADSRVLVSRGEGNTVSLEFLISGCRGTDDTKARGAAFVASESLLGEEVLDKWVGPITCRPFRRGFLGLGRKSEGLELGLLKDVVDRQIEAIRQSLPGQPYYSMDLKNGSHQWSSYRSERQQPDVPDFPGRSDIFCGVTACLDLCMAVGNGTFSSSRFSRHGDVFGYLKIDGDGCSAQDKLDTRTAIEDRIEPILEQANLGRLIGGATGYRYSYIDLAVSDPVRAMEVIRPALVEANVPSRSWFLFMDSDMADEWIGVRPDTPKPPA